MKTKPTPPVNVAKIAKAAGISTRTVNRYREQGVNVSDPAALRAHADAQKHTPKALESGELRAAKLRKIDLECQRLALLVEIDRKRYIPVEDVIRDMTRIGAATRGELSAFLRELPGWAGMTPAEIESRAKAGFDTICRNLSNETAKLYA